MLKLLSAVVLSLTLSTCAVEPVFAQDRCIEKSTIITMAYMTIQDSYTVFSNDKYIVFSSTADPRFLIVEFDDKGCYIDNKLLTEVEFKLWFDGV